LIRNLQVQFLAENLMKKDFLVRSHGAAIGGSGT
jgi:hypothetical protein